MDFVSAAAELDKLAMIRSYLKTRNLEELAAREPELAAQVEALCRAVIALRGAALTLEAHSTLRYSAAVLEPFVELVDVVDQVQGAKGLARLPPEIRPEEVAEYKRLQRFLNSAKAVERIIAKRQAECSP